MEIGGVELMLVVDDKVVDDKEVESGGGVALMLSLAL